MKRILLTGATGYVGGRLLRSLEAGGHAVRCLARHPPAVLPGLDTTEVVAGDCLDEASLDRALAGAECAYYLVHSMAAGSDFAALDRTAAGNFGRVKKDTRTVEVDVPPAQAFAPVRQLGGKAGWYFGNLLWQARGWVDVGFGGVGMRRGRRDPDDCAIGDTIDSWTRADCWVRPTGLPSTRCTC